MSSWSPAALESQIEQYVRAQDTTLGILRLACLEMNDQWIFRITSDSTARPTLEVVPPSGISPDLLLDGRVPEVFFGLPAVTANGTVKIGDFGGDHFRSDWNDEARIARFLKKDTWLGSPTFKASQSEVVWQVLATEHRFSARELARAFNPQHVEKLTYGSLKATLYTFAGGSQVTLRDARLGERVPGELQELLKPIRGAGVTSAMLELGPGWLELGPMGLPVMTDDCRKQLAEAGPAPDQTGALQKAAEIQAKAAMVVQAARLSARKVAARTASRLVCAGNVIGTVPTSEQGLVAVLHKLEVLGAVPLPLFKTLAWAGADGIDAIGDVQFSDVEPVVHEAAIEFEFMFRNFVAHRHPHQHVDLIVCWDQSGELSPTSQPWLWHYKIDGKIIPVLLVSKFPGLTIDAKVTP